MVVDTLGGGGGGGGRGPRLSGFILGCVQKYLTSSNCQLLLSQIDPQWPHNLLVLLHVHVYNNYVGGEVFIGCLVARINIVL